MRFPLGAGGGSHWPLIGCLWVLLPAGSLAMGVLELLTLHPCWDSIPQGDVKNTDFGYLSPIEQWALECMCE